MLVGGTVPAILEERKSPIVCFALAGKEVMSSDPRQLEQTARRERTDEAFQVTEPIRNPWTAPRVFPVIIAVLIGLIVIALLFFLPR
jgi:hypothetical protein